MQKQRLQEVGLQAVKMWALARNQQIEKCLLSTLQNQQLQEAVEAGLRAVNLWAVRRKRVGQFSGGMKRRLSVAVSFIGDPRVVYLDECSTVSRLLKSPGSKM